MIEFVALRRQDIDELAAFIASQQAAPTTAVGFAGSQPAEIAHELSEFADRPAEESFVLARDNGELVGALGFEVDLAKHHTSIWGPLISAANWDAVADHMWLIGAELLPADTERLDVFCHMRNERVKGWAERHALPLHSEQFIMAFDRAMLDQLPFAHADELTPRFHAQFVRLHETSFPNTYYSGPEILTRINDQQRVLVVTEGESVLGYTYLEANPEFGEGHIEFIAVAETARGRGVGLQLLTSAVHWLFSFAPVANIELVVSGANPAALSLYRRAGFKELAHMIVYRKV